MYTNIQQINEDNEKQDPENLPYRFPEVNSSAHQYLKKNGYVVIANVLEEKEIEKAIELAWKFLSSCGMKRYDIETWKNYPGYPTGGAIHKSGVGQCEFQWFVRSCPGVLKAFSAIWNVGQSQLLTSLDGFGAFRPWSYDPTWKTHSDWYHVDQNPAITADLECYQGLVTMYDQNEYSGGTVVIPGTHKHIKKICGNVLPSKSHFIKMKKGNPVLELPKLLIHAKRGDLVLWDGRLVHCNTPATKIYQPIPNKSNEINEKKLDNKKEEIRLLRLVSYICMTPKNKSTPEVLSKRLYAYKNNQTSNHWPHQFFCMDNGENLRKKSMQQLNPTQLSLLGF